MDCTGTDIEPMVPEKLPVTYDVPGETPVTMPDAREATPDELVLNVVPDVAVCVLPSVKWAVEASWPFSYVPVHIRVFNPVTALEYTGKLYVMETDNEASCTTVTLVQFFTLPNETVTFSAPVGVSGAVLSTPLAETVPDVTSYTVRFSASVVTVRVEPSEKCAITVSWDVVDTESGESVQVLPGVVSLLMADVTTM